MFFVVSKMFGIAFEPATFLVIAGLAGIGLTWIGARRLGRRLAFGALIATAVVFYAPLGALLLRPLEDRFPPPPADMPPPEGIIVLGGALDADRSAARGEVTFDNAGARLTSAVVLARRYPQARLVFTGGSGHLSGGGVSEASVVRGLWLALGVPAARMSFETKSRTTFENATMTRALVDPTPGQRWLLVTSAWHMPRAVGIFRQAGFSVVPYPVAYLTFGDARDFRVTFDPGGALARLDAAAHEWIGLLAYRLSGKTDAVFPAP